MSHPVFQGVPVFRWNQLSISFPPGQIRGFRGNRRFLSGTGITVDHPSGKAVAVSVVLCCQRYQTVFPVFPGGVGVTVVNRAPFPVDRCFFPVWPFHRIGRCFLVSNPVFTGFGLVTTVSEYRGTVLSMCGSGQHRVCGVFRFRVNVTDLRSFRQLGAFDRLAV
ncbi:hypothetical protein, partial [Actinoalloteichus caeruleus]|uniref:hypothetical protein n=1 Tax=Actinoalloteichus cyanogriseus TaxID=2893586 RepID=UPI0020A4F2F3